MKLTIDPNALQKLEHSNYPDVLTTKEVQVILGIGRISVYNLIESGQLEAFQIGRTYKIPKKSLRKYLEEKGAKT